MKHCNTCIHWEKPERDYREVPGVGLCQAVVMYWDATEWTKDSDRQLKNEYKGKLAFVQDGSDYSASLLTLPTFGCIQHEEAK